MNRTKRKKKLSCLSVELACPYLPALGHWSACFSDSRFRGSEQRPTPWSQASGLPPNYTISLPASQLVDGRLWDCRALQPRGPVPITNKQIMHTGSYIPLALLLWRTLPHSLLPRSGLPHSYCADILFLLQLPLDSSFLNGVLLQIIAWKTCFK